MLKLLIIVLPLILAGVWAYYNIGAAAIDQGKDFMSKDN